MFETTNQSTYSPKPMSWYWYDPFESPNSARPKLRSWASPAGMPHLNFIPSPQYHTHPKVSANMRISHGESPRKPMEFLVGGP